MSLRGRIKRLEREAGEDMVVLVCKECGEELRVRDGLELDLVAHSWAEEAKKRGVEVYGETPSDVYRVLDHPHGELSLADISTGEPWLKGLIGQAHGSRLMGLRDKLKRLEQEAEGNLYETLTLPDGTEIRHAPGEMFEVLSAVLDDREHRLLPYLRQIDTKKGMGGLVRALEASKERRNGA